MRSLARAKRFAATLLALVATLAGSGTAVAHGVAHLRGTAVSSNEGISHASAHASEAPAATPAVALEQSHPGAAQHAGLHAPCVAPQPAHAASMLPAVRLELGTSVAVARVAPAPAAASGEHPSPPDATPAQPRAPPTLLLG